MQEKINNIKIIGVISDTHIPTRAKFIPGSVAKHFNGVDFIIHCGDIVAEEVLAELKCIAPVYPVKGNMDPHEINEPEERIFDINGRFSLCVAHGSGAPFGIKQQLYRKFKKYNPHMIIYGHTHVSENEKYNNVIFFNPGSCTQGLRGNSIGLLKIDENNIVSEIIRL